MYIALCCFINDVRIHQQWIFICVCALSIGNRNNNNNNNFIFGRKRKCRRKRNSIYGRKRNENENRHSFSAEKWKWKSPDNISVFPFHTFSHHVSPTMRRQYLVQFRLFLQVSLVDGIPLSSCTVYRYLCVIFLDDISTREQFAFLVYCYRVKAIFTIYALCFTGVCVA